MLELIRVNTLAVIRGSLLKKRFKHFWQKDSLLGPFLALGY